MDNFQLSPLPIPADTSKRIGLLRELLQNGQPAPLMRHQCRMDATQAVMWQAAMILDGSRKILSGSQTKLDKAKGAVNRGLTLASADEATPWLHDKFTACAGSTSTCVAVCVGSRTGQGRLQSSAIARIGRTLALSVDPQTFLRRLDAEIERANKAARKKGIMLAVRANVASDHPHLAGRLAAEHPTVAFYDYTAVSAAMGRDDGVRRVYSHKGAERLTLTLRHLEAGRGVACVFPISSRSGDPLPATWRGYPVIDGDVDDLWFMRAPSSGGFVVGLKVKGNNAQIARAKAGGFTVAM